MQSFEIDRPAVPLGSGIVLQLSMNLVPFLGVVFFDWSVFALIYAFWLETLGISFLNTIKIAFSKGGETSGLHFGKALRYFVLRILILLFYMIFILTFVGFMVSEKQAGRSFIEYLIFLDDTFRLTIIIFFLVKFFEMVYNFFYKKEYLSSLPTSFHAFTESRIIVMHVVIVLGVFAFQFFNEKLGDHAGIVAFAGIFVLVKSIADYFSFTLARKSEDKKSE